MSTLEFGLSSHVGLVRSDNQDTAGRFPPDIDHGTRDGGVLLVVADGMGGHKGGKMASEIAVRTLSAEYAAGEGSVAERLLAGFEAANTAIAEYGSAHAECRGMGTTLTALVLKDGQVYIAQVGDSRAYKVTEEGITQLTEDHSIVAEWLRKGWLTEEQAKFHPERSLLYRALGVGPDVKIDILETFTAADGDRFVLCSDGLTNLVEDDEIRDVVLSESPQAACDRLVAMALDRGGHDNVTVQVVRYGAG